MRKRTTLGEILDIGRNSSTSHLSQSHTSSIISLTSSQTRLPNRPAKGFSFGSSPRNNLMAINLFSPAPKYNIMGIVEINLSKKKGPSMIAGRSDSVEKTPLSYISNNMNPGPGRYNSSKTSKTISGKFGKQNNENVQVEFLNEKKIKNNPGPGAYRPKVVKLKGGKMTTESKRFSDYNKQNRPGPGAYNSTDLDAVSRSSKMGSLSASRK